MRLSLGMDTRNVAKTLHSWGAQLRSIFFLGDEDLNLQTWGFDIADVDDYPAGAVTFSGLEIKSANFVHVGKLCFWSLAFDIQPSADLTGFVIKNVFGVGLPRLGYEGTFGLAAFGRIWFWRATAFGAVNLEVPPQLFYSQGNMVIRPGILPAPGGLFYTNGGTIPTKFELTGFYFTRDLPRR